MKILQIINSLNTGGAEKLLLDTIPLYISKGIKMDILLFWDNEFMFTEKINELSFCNIYILNKSSSISNIYNPLHILKIAKIIKEYDVVHVHLFPAQYFVPIAKMISFSNAKLIFTEHNTTNNRIKNKIYSIIDRFFYKPYEKVICISLVIRDVIVKHSNLPLEKLEIIKNGVDIEKIYNAKKLDRQSIHKSIGNNDILLIQVSAFRLQKDQATLIKALSLLNQKYKLLLAGEGPFKQSCIELAKELNISDRVLFLGNRSDIPKLLKTADIIVLSSKYEGLSLSSIEAMASGRPFIASNVPGLREIVDGFGVLFPFGNDRALKDEIEKLTLNKDYYSRIVESCLLRAKQYDINKMVEKHIKLYNEI